MKRWSKRHIYDVVSPLLSLPIISLHTMSLLIPFCHRPRSVFPCTRTRVLHLHIFCTTPHAITLSWVYPRLALSDTFCVEICQDPKHQQVSCFAGEDWIIEGTWYARNRSEPRYDNFCIHFGDFSGVVELSVGDEEGGGQSAHSSGSALCGGRCSGSRSAVQHAKRECAWKLPRISISRLLRAFRM